MGSCCSSMCNTLRPHTLLQSAFLGAFQLFAFLFWLHDEYMTAVALLHIIGALTLFCLHLPTMSQHLGATLKPRKSAACMLLVGGTLRLIGGVLAISSPLYCAAPHTRLLCAVHTLAFVLLPLALAAMLCAAMLSAAARAHQVRGACGGASGTEATPLVQNVQIDLKALSTAANKATSALSEGHTPEMEQAQLVTMEHFEPTQHAHRPMWWPRRPRRCNIAIWRAASGDACASSRRAHNADGEAELEDGVRVEQMSLGSIAGKLVKLSVTVRRFHI